MPPIAKTAGIPVVSLVFPVYNEEEVLPALLKRVQGVIANLSETCEVVFVNDGSRDTSLLLLRQAAADYPWVRVVSFARNFGHQTAVSAGIAHACGEAVVVMDSDLQDPPELLPEMLQLWRNGNEVVYCVRKKRKENIVKKICYAGFYRLLKSVSDMDIPLDSGDFCLMDRKVVDIICALPERNRFLRGLRAWVGFRQTALEYERAAREAGEPKYNFRRLVKLATDGIYSFSYAPLKLAGTVGVLTALLAVLYALKVLIWRVFLHDIVPGFATLAIAVLLLGGIQLITLYFIGEYIGRIYDETKQRPLYIVGERIGFSPAIIESQPAASQINK
jgi:glycosyltransferase involved in cell wall biosynthesis